MDAKDTLTLLLSGLAAGDSLGSTSEFIPRGDIPRVYEKHSYKGWPFRQVGGGAFRWPVGSPTDDTDMALCLVRSFRKLKRFDGNDVGRRFVQWMRSEPPDIGSTTRRALSALAAGRPWHEAGLTLYRDNPDGAANGSLMRNGVVAGMARDLDEAFRISISHGLITHYAPLPQLCCAAQSYLIRTLLEGQAFEPPRWVDAFHERFTRWLDRTDDAPCLRWRDQTAPRMEAAWQQMRQADWDADSFNPFTLSFAGRDGWCLLTLQIALWALQWSRRERPFPVPQGFPPEVFQRGGPFVLGWVAMIGHDSDTYGAAAGPLIAAAHGSLPADLTTGLLALA